MKTRTLVFLALLYCALSSCQNSDNGIWKSTVSDLELKFDNNWKVITPYLDTENKIIFGITDQIDHSSITIKINQDIPKEQLSDENYAEAVKEQMLKANPANKLLTEDEIYFKGKKYKRQIFLMNTKFGELLQTVYIHRDGKKMTGIQIGYPKTLVEKPNEELPIKVKKVLDEMKI